MGSPVTERSSRFRRAVATVALLVLALPGMAAASEPGSERGRSARELRADNRLLAVADTDRERFEPEDGKTILIVGQDRDSTDEYVREVGVVPAGFMTYTHINAPVLGLHAPINFGGWSHGQHFVDNYPGTVLQVGMGIEPALAPLGASDAGILLFADWLKSVDRPVFVRLGYEFDHGNKGWNPQEFVVAWRYIVDRLRAEGVTNAAYVWHSTGHGSTNLDAWYPGDDYVDWVAVSIFHLGYESHPNNLVHANAMADFGDAHGKPMMLAETTPHASNTATADPNTLWTNWHQNVADFIAARDVKAWCYINQNWEEVGWAGWGDSRVQNNPVLKDLWLTETGSSRYLQQSPTLYAELGYAG